MALNKISLYSLVECIEEAVQSRNQSEAMSLIKDLPLSFREISKNRIKLSEWWRRLGNNDRAIKALKVSQGTNLLINYEQIDEWLHLLKLLNNLGLSKYALRVADRVLEYCVLDQQYYDLGQIYLTNFEYQKALNCFKKIIITNFPHPKVYILKVSIADCLAGLNLFDEAIDLTDSILKDTDKILFKAISATAKAEYLFKIEKYEEACEILLPWKSFFINDNSSVDYLLWCKWIGLSKLALGFYEEAKFYLNEASIGLKSYKPEGISDILYWQWFLEKDKIKKRELVFKLSLGCHYLSKKQQLSLKYHLQKVYKISKKDESVQVKFFDRASMHLRINNSLDLFINAIDRAYILEGKYNLSNTLSFKLAHILGLAQVNGEISKWRAIDLIYDEETIPYESLEERFKKILKDCRHKFFPIKMVLNFIHITGDYQIITTSSHTKKSFKIIEGESFLRKHANFTVNEMLKYLGIKKTKAYELIELWKNAKLIRPIKPGEYYVQNISC